MGPLAAVSPKIEPIDWLRDLLPEHLWLAALADKFGLERVEWRTARSTGREFLFSKVA